jgi:tRNA threonylcarbamoyladenosine biosynthesis protein TsaE
MKLQTYITRSATQTKVLGALLAKTLHPGDIVGLEGELGSGKTCLIQGICEALGAGLARSPSFTLICEYQGQYPIRHIDLYRLQNAGEILDLGWEELANSENIILIEWADRLQDWHLNYKYYIKLEYGEEADTRSITVNGD